MTDDGAKRREKIKSRKNNVKRAALKYSVGESETLAQFTQELDAPLGVTAAFCSGADCDYVCGKCDMASSALRHQAGERLTEIWRAGVTAGGQVPTGVGPRLTGHNELVENSDVAAPPAENLPSNLAGQR